MLTPGRRAWHKRRSESDATTPQFTRTLILTTLSLALLLLLATTVTAQSAQQSTGQPAMKICKHQTYALCAAARCNVFDMERNSK